MPVDYMSLSNNILANREMAQRDQQLRMQKQRQDLQNQALQMEMQQAALMNPIALQAKQLELSQAEAMGPLLQAYQKTQTAGLQQSQDIAGAKFNEWQQGAEGRIQAAKTAQDMAEAQLATEQLRPDLIADQMSQAQASTRAQDASTRLSNLKIDTAKSEAAQAKQLQQQLDIGLALDQYEALKKTNPQVAEQFKNEQFAKHGVKNVDDVDLGVARAISDMGRMKAGEFEQVNGMPGLVFDKNSGRYVGGGEALEHAFKMKEVARKKGAELRGRDLKSVQDTVQDKFIKEPSKAILAYNNLQSLNVDASATDKLAAIFGFMKSLDPNSVVQKGEQEMLKTTGGAYDSLITRMQGIMGSGPLSQNIMDQMVNTAEKFAIENQKAAAQGVDSYLNVLKNDGSLGEQALKDIKGMIPRVNMRTSDEQIPRDNPVITGEIPLGSNEAPKPMRINLEGQFVQ